MGIPQTSIFVKTIGVCYGELEVWAFDENHPERPAEDGQTYEEAVESYVDKYPEEYSGKRIEIKRYDRMPGAIKVNYNT